MEKMIYPAIFHKEDNSREIEQAKHNQKDFLERGCL